MNLLPLEKISHSILSLFNTHPEGSNLGVIHNDFSGSAVLINRLILDYERIHGAIIHHLNARDFISVNTFFSKICEKAKEELGEYLNDEEAPSSYIETMLLFIDLLVRNNIKYYVIIIDEFETLDEQLQYSVSSQMRNTREKMKVQNKSLGFHSIILGKFSNFKLQDICRRRGTSASLDECYYIDKSDPNFTLIHFSRGDLYRINALILSANYEISNGSLGLMEIISERSEEDIFKIINDLTNSEELLNKIRNSVEQLSSSQKKIILSLIRNEKIFRKFDEELEQLYTTGLVALTRRRAEFRLSLRSWIHFLILFDLFIQEKSISGIKEELIPPIISLNKYAYELILSIENTIRNVIIQKLSEYSYKIHPLENLNCLGKIKKASNSGNSYTILEWCRHQARRQKEIFGIETYNTLSSYLDVGDYETILCNDKTHHYFSNIFPPVDELKNILERFKRNRNPIAHHNLVSYTIYKELREIRKELFVKLSYD